MSSSIDKEQESAAWRGVKSAILPPEPIVFGAPLIGEEEINEVVATLRSGWIGTGPKTERFEEEFAEFVGCRYAIATNSGTAALHLALLALGVGPGDEVITTPLTFAATANVIEHCGATPVFADVRARDGNIDPARVSECVTPRTKVILPVHYTGAAANVHAIRDGHPDIPILVDAAHSVEMTYPDGSSAAKAGATCTAFSFYVTKNLTSGEGGMLVTDRPDIAGDAAVRRLHGLDRDAWKRHASVRHRSYEVVRPGFKYNMTDLQASLAIHQLARIERAHARRCEIWERYNDSFYDLVGVDIPPSSLRLRRDRRHARHLYTLWFDWEALELTREDFVAAVGDLGVGVGWHFQALHLQRFYRDRYGYEPGSFPIAESIAHRTLSIPLSAALTDEQVDRVILAVRSAVRDR